MILVLAVVLSAIGGIDVAVSVVTRAAHDQHMRIREIDALDVAALRKRREVGRLREPSAECAGELADLNNRARVACRDVRGIEDLVPNAKRAAVRLHGDGARRLRRAQVEERAL